MEQLLYITIYYKQISAKHHPEITLFEILGILFGVAIPLISDMPIENGDFPWLCYGLPKGL